MECRFSFPQTHPSVMLRFRWRRVIGDFGTMANIRQRHRSVSGIQPLV